MLTPGNRALDLRIMERKGRFNDLALPPKVPSALGDLVSH